MEELSDYLIQFSKQLGIEIEFFSDQISTNLNYVSAYERYISKNEQYINDNPEEEEDVQKFAFDNYHSYFPYIINNSLLITFDSYFDNKFYLLTKGVLLKTQNKFSIKETNGSNFNECFKCFNKELGMQIPKDDSNWKLITNYHKIRNLIVHHNSSLLRSQTENITIDDILKIKTHNDYKLINDNRESIWFNELNGKFYIFDINLLLVYLSSIKTFLNMIIEKVKTEFFNLAS